MPEFLAFVIDKWRVEHELLDPPTSFAHECLRLQGAASDARVSTRRIAHVTVKWLKETYQDFYLRHLQAHRGRVVYPVEEWEYALARFREARQSCYAGIVGPLGIDIYCPETRCLEVFRLVPADRRETPNTLFVPLLQPAFAANNCLLVHAAGVVLEGSGVLVTGPSGAGKSTSAFLLGGHILSDDIVCVSEISRTPLVSATPFGRLSNGNCTCQLGAIFFPHKASSFGIRALPAREAAARFLAEHQAFFHSETFPYLRKLIARNALELLHKVPAYELHFDGTFIHRATVLKVLESRKQEGAPPGRAPV